MSKKIFKIELSYNKCLKKYVFQYYKMIFNLNDKCKRYFNMDCKIIQINYFFNFDKSRVLLFPSWDISLLCKRSLAIVEAEEERARSFSLLLFMLLLLKDDNWASILLDLSVWFLFFSSLSKNRLLIEKC